MIRFFRTAAVFITILGAIALLLLPSKLRAIDFAKAVAGHRAAGVYRAVWDGTDSRGQRVASGVYFCKMTAGSFTATKKMVMLK